MRQLAKIQARGKLFNVRRLRNRPTQDRRYRSNEYALRNQVIRQLGFTSYAEYLESPLWKNIRQRVLSRNPQCEKCGRRARQVHHSRYDFETLTGKTLRHLHATCGQCHSNAEFGRNGQKSRLKSANAKLGIINQKKNRT